MFQSRTKMTNRRKSGHPGPPVTVSPFTRGGVIETDRVAMPTSRRRKCPTGADLAGKGNVEEKEHAEVVPNDSHGTHRKGGESKAERGGKYPWGLRSRVPTSKRYQKDFVTPGQWLEESSGENQVVTSEPAENVEQQEQLPGWGNRKQRSGNFKPKFPLRRVASGEGRKLRSVEDDGVAKFPRGKRTNRQSTHWTKDGRSTRWQLVAVMLGISGDTRSVQEKRLLRQRSNEVGDQQRVSQCVFNPGTKGTRESPVGPVLRSRERYNNATKKKRSAEDANMEPLLSKRSGLHAEEPSRCWVFEGSNVSPVCLDSSQNPAREVRGSSPNREDLEMEVIRTGELALPSNPFGERQCSNGQPQIFQQAQACEDPMDQYFSVGSIDAIQSSSFNSPPEFHSFRETSTTDLSVRGEATIAYSSVGTAAAQRPFPEMENSSIMGVEMSLAHDESLGSPSQSEELQGSDEDYQPQTPLEPVYYQVAGNAGPPGKLSDKNKKGGRRKVKLLPDLNELPETSRKNARGRKKHRPKVVREDRPARGRKPKTTEGNAPKRKKPAAPRRTKATERATPAAEKDTPKRKKVAPEVTPNGQGTGSPPAPENFRLFGAGAANYGPPNHGSPAANFAESKTLGANTFPGASSNGYHGPQTPPAMPNFGQSGTALPNYLSPSRIPSTPANFEQTQRGGEALRRRTTVESSRMAENQHWMQTGSQFQSPSTPQKDMFRTPTSNLTCDLGLTPQTTTPPVGSSFTTPELGSAFTNASSSPSLRKRFGEPSGNEPEGKKVITRRELFKETSESEQGRSDLALPRSGLTSELDCLPQAVTQTMSITPSQMQAGASELVAADSSSGRLMDPSAYGEMMSTIISASSTANASLSPDSRMRAAARCPATRRRIATNKTTRSLSNENSTNVELRIEEKIEDRMSLMTVEGGHVTGLELAIVNENKAIVVAKPKKFKAKVMLDDDDMRMWKLVMAHGADYFDGNDPQAEKWKKERALMKSRAEQFVERMHWVQGNRRFSVWKGSVVDSVVGAFLTQNVSDHLSSSAFMNLAAAFPVVREEKVPMQEPAVTEMVPMPEPVVTEISVEGPDFPELSVEDVAHIPKSDVVVDLADDVKEMEGVEHSDFKGEGVMKESDPKEEAVKDSKEEGVMKKSDPKEEAVKDSKEESVMKESDPKEEPVKKPDSKEEVFRKEEVVLKELDSIEEVVLKELDSIEEVVLKELDSIEEVVPKGLDPNEQVVMKESDFKGKDGIAETRSESSLLQSSTGPEGQNTIPIVNLNSSGIETPPWAKENASASQPVDIKEGIFAVVLIVDETGSEAADSEAQKQQLMVESCNCGAGPTAFPDDCKTRVESLNGSLPSLSLGPVETELEQSVVSAFVVAESPNPSLNSGDCTSSDDSPPVSYGVEPSLRASSEREDGGSLVGQLHNRSGSDSDIHGEGVSHKEAPEAFTRGDQEAKNVYTRRKSGSSEENAVASRRIRTYARRKDKLLPDGPERAALPESLLLTVGGNEANANDRNAEGEEPVKKGKEIQAGDNEDGGGEGEEVENKGKKGKSPKKALTGIERANLEILRISLSKSTLDWDALRMHWGAGSREASLAEAEENRMALTVSRPTTAWDTEDSVCWKAVKDARTEDISNVIKERGMNFILAGRIKGFLERIYRAHGTLNLEWVRKLPVETAKAYLLSFRGLGLKSVECIRLLTLHHLAFPVDTNVGRICVRLGWVPLEKLPDSLQLHLLELYPVQETIQKYLWPRLCKLDQRFLYELHYQMITFGKVFCTKSKPNCNGCPMRDQCQHVQSAFNRANVLPEAPAADWEENPETLALRETIRKQAIDAKLGWVFSASGQPQPQPELEPQLQTRPQREAEQNTPREQSAAPELDPRWAPTSPRSFAAPIVTEPEDIPDIEELDRQDYQMFGMPDPTTYRSHPEDPEDLDYPSPATSQALVVISEKFGSLPAPKLKNVGRLRTVHFVYELPDGHPLLRKAQMGPLEPDDPSNYLLAIWGEGEQPESNPQMDDIKKFSKVEEDNTKGNEYVNGTLLVPCRTAMKGRFPLNGTYFQVNEVFADHETSIKPMRVPRKEIWGLRRRFVYFGTSVTTIFRGLMTGETQACFWKGYVCVRGFDYNSKAPKPLVARLHFPASRPVSRKLGGKGKRPQNGDDEDDEDDNLIDDANNGAKTARTPRTPKTPKPSKTPRRVPTPRAEGRSSGNESPKGTETPPRETNPRRVAREVETQADSDAAVR